MPNAVTAARIISRELPVIGIVAFSVSDASEEVLACVEAGATAYLSRD